MTTVSRILRGPIFVMLLLFLAYATPVSARSVMPESNGVLAARTIHNGTAPGCKPCFPNVQASEGGQPVNEDPIAANPANSQNLLTGGNDGNCTSSRLGFYASNDGGTTWNHTCMSALPGASGGTDPSVGFDATGVAYITGVETNTPDGYDVVFEKSTDGGMTWSAPAVAVKPLFSHGIIEFDWLWIDTSASSPHVNTLYITATQNDGSGHTEISVSHSTNGGITWTTVGVEGEQTFPTADYFSNGATDKGGTVYVTWQRCVAAGSKNDCGDAEATFYVSKSTDGGNTWSTPVPIGTALLAPDTCGRYFGCLPNTKEPLSNIPVIAIDINTGNLYVVNYTYTGKYTRVQVTVSTNGGVTWGIPVAVAPSSDTHDQFFPWISVNSSKGIIGVTWLDRRNDPKNLLYEAYAATANDVTLLVKSNVQIAAKPSNPNNDGSGGKFMGYYTGNAWDGPKLYISWMDSRNGKNDQDEVGKCYRFIPHHDKLSGC